MNARSLPHSGSVFGRLSAVLVGIAFAVSAANAAQRQYTLAPAPNATIRSADSVFFQQFTPAANGQIYVIGSFNYINGAKHLGFGRLEADGPVDFSFAPSFNGLVPFKCASTTGGAVWCVGPFAPSAPVFQVVRLKMDGSRDESIAPIGLDSGFIRDLISLPDGGFYVVDGPSGNTRFQRFAATGAPSPSFATITYPSFAASWAFSPSGGVAVVGFGVGPSSVTVFDASGAVVPGASAGIPPNFAPSGAVYDASGALILSGQTFGQNVVLIRILPDGTVDSSFAGVAPYAQVAGSSVIRLDDGHLIMLASITFGSATSILEFSSEGAYERSLPIVAADGAAAFSVSLQSLGADYLLSGRFERVNGIVTPQVARIDASGAVENFHAQFESNGQVNSMARSASGALFIGGDFTEVSGQPVGGLVALTATNTIDAAFPRLAFGANALVPTLDGGVIALGTFPAFAGTSTGGLVKLRSDRTVDTAFLAGVSLFQFQTGVALADGSVLLGGAFGNYPGVAWAASYLTRVLPDGSIDASFNNHTTLAGGSGFISTLSVDASSRILVAGSFTEFQGAARPSLARTEVNGNVDPTFVPSVGLSLYGSPGNLRCLSDGRFYVRGVSGDASAGTAPTLLRFSVDGTRDSTFAPDFGSGVSAYTIAPDGTLYVATYGVPARLSRFSATGTIDPSFSFQLDGPVNALTIDANGEILVGGGFTTINGIGREAVARLVPIPLGVTIDGPPSLQVRLLSTITLAANVAGASDAVTYQWYHDGRAIGGATSAALTLTHLVPKDSGAYTVAVASDGETAESAAVNVHVQPGPPWH